MKKTKDVVIYRDQFFYPSFPSIVRLPDGELLCAFRRAPERRWYGGRCSHSDPNSHLVLVRSQDGGTTWTQEPELIHAHALGGSQDPCLSLLPDGSLLCASYLWIIRQCTSPGDPALNKKTGWGWAFGGGYLVRSNDRGRHWEGPFSPPPVPGDTRRTEIGQPLPAYNRGNILVGSDGLLYRAVVRQDTAYRAGRRTSVHLMVSTDLGGTWDYRCPIAIDEQIGFNETWLHETQGGDIVAFLRTHGTNTGEPAVARSKDRGRRFEPWQKAGFIGHPHCAAQLLDGRVLVAYGYRHEPFGIRARILDAECFDIAGSPEIILRDDGATGDVGYPWPVVMPDGRVLVVYYFNSTADIPPEWDQNNSDGSVTSGGGVRVIAGTWLGPERRQRGIPPGIP